MRLRWQRLGSRAVGEYRIFRVMEMALERRRELDGSEAGPNVTAYVLDCPDWCNVIPLTDDGRIVLIRQYRFGTDCHTLEIPGGIVDRNEDPAEAAARELREETGHVARRIEPLGTVAPNPAIQSNVCHMFVAHGCRPEAEVDFDEHEDIDLELRGLEDVRRMLHEGKLDHALVQVALARFFLRQGAT